MKLTTQILDSNGTPINYEITESNEGDYFTANVLIADKIVGHMFYSMAETYLHIRRMDNFTSKDNDNQNDIHPPSKKYKHVGTALFEYAFRKSLENERGGNVELEARGNSAAAYWNMGLRRKNFSKATLDKLLFQYSSNPIAKIKQEIILHHFYDLLCDMAAFKLNKDQTHISFEEAIQYGLYAKVNDDFEKEIASRTYLSSQVCADCNMQNLMYIPPQMIPYLYKKFQIPIPEKNKSLAFDNNSPIKHVRPTI